MLKLTQRIFMSTITYFKLDPVGSSVRYEMMKLRTGSVIGYYEAVAVGNW